MINYLFPPLGGGGGVAAYTIAQGFIRAGYEVDYITTRVDDLKSFELVDGISVYRVRVIGGRNYFPATMISLVSYPFFAFWKGLCLCLRNNYSFINTHFVVPAGPAGFVLSKLFNLRHIISIHGGDIYDPTRKISPHQYWFLRVCIRFLLNHSDRIIAQSSNTRENCIRYYSPHKEIFVVPLPYEPISFSPASKKDLGLDEMKRYIIGVGMLVKRKGFDVYIKALARMDDSVEGIIVGDGPELDYLKSLSKELGISSRVRFVGYVSQEKKFQYLSNADVFVLSSVHEGFGIVLQEAMQVGLPIVATNNGGQGDFIIDGVNGFLVPVSDDKMLAERVDQILSSKEAVDRMRSHNLSAVQKFGINVIITDLLHLSLDDKKYE